MILSQIQCRNITLSFGSLTVLGGVDLTIGPGDRIGIIAPNGVGKSTLLKVLSGDLVPDGGTVMRNPATTTVIRLAQEHDRDPGESVYDYLARRTGVRPRKHVSTRRPSRWNAATRRPTNMPRRSTHGSASAPPTCRNVPP